MKVRYLKLAAGVAEGTERELPDVLAKRMIDMGVVEEVVSRKNVEATEEKEESIEFDTKEEKQISKRRTKNRK